MKETLPMKSFIFLLLIFVQAFSQVNNEIDDVCSDFDSNCGDCIRNSNCRWCSEQKNDSIYGRHCFSMKIDLTSVCYELEEPLNEWQPTKDVPLSIIKKGEVNTASEKIVQFKPQEFKLRLRKGHPMNITLTFRQVRDYPLDLYYLMDLSQSMYIHKQTLAKVGTQLARTMRKLTSQFQIGFGSFVDKVMLPFVNIHEEALKNPCRDKKCATPFSFRNNLPLTENDEKFEIEVENAQISTNIDSPEGGLDALMQAIVCEQEIGWRDQVRKIIVFSTDAQFHSAGDGKLAGVIEPNDGKCHLDGGSYYKKYDVYDYPSISHINEVTKQYGVNIIFAVKRYDSLYKQVAEIIDGASYAPLSKDSKNIIKLIENVYNNITGKVEIKERYSTHENLFSLKFSSNCRNEDHIVEKEYLACSNVEEGETFQVTVEIQLKDCPKNHTDRHSTILIGTKEETVKLHIEMLCDCSCELQSVDKTMSAYCSGAGYQQCGVCECGGKYFGDTCQCMRDSSLPEGQSDTGKCKPADAGPEDPVCSGNGGCLCEKCSCWGKDYNGKFCQWNRANCRKTPFAEVCSGHGNCERDRCHCNDDWEGEFCECPHQRECMATKEDTLVCSGTGKCVCGKCSCSIRDGVLYTGEFCEDCPSCEGGKCLTFRPCVQCLKWRSGIFSERECSKNCTTSVKTTKTLDDSINNGARLCTFTDFSTNCDFNFTYKYLAKGKYQLLSQSLQKCPGEINVSATVFGVIGGVVGIGILTLLIWKILTTVHDKREYTRFMTEYENQKWAGANNPLYNPPTTEVQNPAYGN